MILFSKQNCGKCSWLKEKSDLSGVEVMELDDPTASDMVLAERWAALSWHEAVQKAETGLPMLVLDNGTIITGAIQIKNILEGR